MFIAHWIRLNPFLSVREREREISFLDLDCPAPMRRHCSGMENGHGNGSMTGFRELFAVTVRPPRLPRKTWVTGRVGVGWWGLVGGWLVGVGGYAPKRCKTFMPTLANPLHCVSNPLRLPMNLIGRNAIYKPSPSSRFTSPTEI